MRFVSFYAFNERDESRPRMTVVSEGGRPGSFVVELDEVVLSSIAFQLVPLTYDEYEARFPEINLNDVFPFRPLPAESMHVLDCE